ncbi:MAG TPA: ATP-binding cassette domain-containing protein [Mycobacteriales bacterium]|jgi:branched-chain amino acid transport system ATP-binding protein|nr:ATP-binding cassette domain-containing protein [Mycobacteriales bacterium]
MTAPALLEIDEVSKRFGQVLVADRLSIAVPEGATLGVVGPNGAGKTSLFGMVAGDIPIDSGDIRFGGESILAMNTARRCQLGIARTFQVPHPFVGMTVFENVLVAAHQGAGLRRAAATDLALDAIEQAGLTTHVNIAAGRLGLLSRKRLEVARALATSPRLLLLDEVAGGLTDPEVAELVEIVRAINSRGTAVIWIEHVVRALLSSVDRLICLAVGQLIADGDPREVLGRQQVKEIFLGTDSTVAEP